MGTRIVKLPDVGEGVAEAEIVEWHVEVGQSVLEDQILAAVMTDKATVEIPSPVAGKVLALGGEVGSTLAVGAELVRLEVAGEGNAEVAAAPREAVAPAPVERLTTPPPAPKAPAPTPVEAATPVARGS
ncbi:MAG: 2-oxo acid dehydrogenase subunit E2, partial [Reyranella sp.]|nr:2-oxo acid dehydrogenase subunit E2 [Reyranella sp.]